MSLFQSGIDRPLVIVDARSLVTENPELHELALTAGMGQAIRLLTRRLEHAYQALHQPTVIVADPRYLSDTPLKEPSWAPGQPFTVLIAVPHAKWSSREELLRGLTATAIAEGSPVEVVVADRQLADEVEALGAVMMPVDRYDERINRGMARWRADRIRAERELADTEGLVDGLIDASHPGPDAEDEKESKAA